MRPAMLAILVTASACGGDPAREGADAAVDQGPATAACSASFSDNFAETWSGPPSCAAITIADGHTMLALSIPVKTLDAPLDVSIDLGEAAAPGTYTAQTLATPWRADALHEFEMTSCLYHAGTASVPPGTFTLALDAVDGQAHGKLDLLLYVLARPYTYCGETNVERVAIVF